MTSVRAGGSLRRWIAFPAVDGSPGSTTRPPCLGHTVSKGAPDLLEALLQSDVPMALRALIRHVVDGLVVALYRGRVYSRIDVPTFRLDGRACARTEYSYEVLAEVLAATAEVVRDELVLPPVCLGGRLQPADREARLVHLCRVIDAFSLEAHRLLKVGVHDVCSLSP